MREDSKRVYIGNLPLCVQKFELRDMFGRFGEVVDVYIPRKRLGKTVLAEGYGYAFVEMLHVESAKLAIAGLDGEYGISGKKLCVRVADGRKALPGSYAPHHSRPKRRYSNSRTKRDF